MSDDHAAHAISAYGSRIKHTPHIERIAAGGMKFDNCFCTNALCAPSRASILAGTYSHVNGVTTQLHRHIDASQPSFPAILQECGYQTGLVGEWHLGHGRGHDPVGFDDWRVLIGQGPYFDPALRGQDGERTVAGYTTDIITDRAVRWLDERDPGRPFCLLIHHKAPHRPWQPDDAHAELFADDVPVPATFGDDYTCRSRAAVEATMRVSEDLGPTDLEADPPPGLSDEQHAHWCYQRYIKDTCGASRRWTTTSAECSTTSRHRAGRRTRWWCTPPTRGSSWVTTVGTTSGSCTRSPSGCLCWCDGRRRSRQALGARRW